MSEDMKATIGAIILLVIILSLGGLAVQGVCLLLSGAALGFLHSVGVFVAAVIFLAIISQ